ncbi:hypothetical protein [Thiosulfatimonas sediminis]|uniref:hypothetical protein n=1 Tax=Thiosulfatimonas sediminis TaxID=2675054 RepID=UPI0015660DBD|nr:hypothetical protein [Thiosulfatimonas sediminis]
MAELIDILPPISPQSVLLTPDFSGWLLGGLLLLACALIWFLLRTSKVWKLWWQLRRWQVQDTPESLWGLVGILQQWQMRLPYLPLVHQRSLQLTLQQITFLASQRQRLSIAQQQALATSLRQLRTVYWRIIFSGFLCRLQRPFLKGWSRLQPLRSRLVAKPEETTHER